MEWIAAIAAALNVFFVASLLGLAYVRTRGMEKHRKFQEVLTIFKELKSPEIIGARRYIYENFPESIEELSKEQLKAHLQKAEPAFIIFDRIGYWIDRGHIDPDPLIENYWALIWRSWQKSKNLINWARDQRGQKNSLGGFEDLFKLAESYRVENKLPGPKFF